MAAWIKISLLLLLASCSPAEQKEGQEELELRKCYIDFRKALLGNNAKETAKYISSESISNFGYLLQSVKHSVPSALDLLTLNERFIVLSVRHRLEKDQIMALDPGSFMNYVIDSGLVEMQAIGKISIISASCNDNFGTARISKDPRSRELITFTKEGNSWKLDLHSLFSMADKNIHRDAKLEKMEADDYLLKSIGARSGRETDGDIWVPVEKRK